MQQQALGYLQCICFPTLSVSASSQQSATREQTEMKMREGAAQGHPDNTERYAESLFLSISVSFTLTMNTAH